MIEPGSSVARYLDTIELIPKQTGVAARVEIIAYPDGHAGIGKHPLRGKQELLDSIAYLFDLAHDDAVARKTRA
jgi:hypothetical protein